MLTREPLIQIQSQLETYLASVEGLPEADKIMESIMTVIAARQAL